MKKETKIFILISVILVAVLTAIDIQTKGKITSLIGSVNPMNLKSSDVSYTNNSQSNVQGAIDALYNRTLLKNRTSNFIEAYTYNASTCVTGNESTCVATTCYKTKSANACPAGTIIKYKVNDQEVQTFHEMYDDASTITMQAQRNTVYNTAWITKLDYDGGSSAKNDKGPLTILAALESATAGWEYVNDQTYTMGTTTFKTNAYTGCSTYSSCSSNPYTLTSRTAKARMITLQETASLGCTTTSKSCPKWMYNYLKSSTSNGGTVNDTSTGPSGNNNSGYWTMSAYSSTTNNAWFVRQSGVVYYGNVSYVDDTNYGARAVVQVSK